MVRVDGRLRVEGHFGGLPGGVLVPGGMIPGWISFLNKRKEKLMLPFEAVRMGNPWIYCVMKECCC